MLLELPRQMPPCFLIFFQIQVKYEWKLLFELPGPISLHPFAKTLIKSHWKCPWSSLDQSPYVSFIQSLLKVNGKCSRCLLGKFVTVFSLNSS